MRSISTKFLMALGLLTILLFGLVIYQTHESTDRVIKELSDSEASLALEFDLAIRAYIQEHVRPEMEKHVGPGEFVPEVMSTSFVAREVFDKVRERFPEYLLKFSSDNPRNPENLAGPEELAILNRFRENPDLKEWKGRIRIGGRDYYGHFRPRRMEVSCIGCHGESDVAPERLVERYGSEAGFHQEVGDVIAMDTVGIPMDTIDAAVSKQTRHQLLNAIALTIISFASVYVLFRRIVTDRLASIAKHFQRAAQADKPSKLAPIPVKGNDEISVMASSFNGLAARLAEVQESLEKRVCERTAELEAEVARRRTAEEEKLARLDRVRRHQKALAEIATLPAGVEGDLETAAASIIEMAGSALEVERCGLWIVNADREAMHCLDMFRLSTGTHESGQCMKVADTPGLLESLDKGRVIGIVDVRADARIRNFVEKYMASENAASLLAGPIRMSGHVVGGVSFTHCGAPRDWTDDETAFAQQVADQVAQVLANQQRKQAEESLRQHAAELEAANRTLAEATRAAEAATVAKSGFLANMSHEIRTPMTAILGFADFLLENATAPECREAAETVRRNGMYLLEIINGLLDLAKIEAGKMETVRVACSPASIVAEVARLMEGRAREKSLSLEVEYQGRVPPTITTDPALVRQILINLVGNAIKFTDQGGVCVVVRLRGERVPARLEIRVIDTGSGMTEEQIARVFQPFTQADSSTTRRYGGTGLGLTISQQLATLLEGDLSVESEPGRGSTFCLTIPVGSACPGSPQESTSRPTKDRAASDGSMPELRGRILLVEDGLDNQRLISLILGKAGAEVDLAENGLLAVEKVLASPEAYDLVLMDMQMPVMDGYQATRRLREEGYGGWIIALTAHAMGHHREKCLDAGCDGYISKPVDRSLLLQTVRQYLDQDAADEQDESLVVAKVP